MERSRLISDVPQGSVLEWIMFVICENYMNENIIDEVIWTCLLMIWNTMDNNECEKLQADLNKLREWSNKRCRWNLTKINVIWSDLAEMRRPNWKYKLGNKNLHISEKERYLGVRINKILAPEDHINEKK